MSHRIEAADLSVLLTLGIADALADTPARDWARKRIALDFVRAADAKERANKGTQAEPRMQEAS